MAQVTNNGNVTPIGLPNGVLVPPQQTVEVDGDVWDKIKAHKVIAFYLKHSLLSAVTTEGDGPADGYTREQLVARLVELGATPGPTSKDETLRKKLAELLTAKLKELGVPVADEGVSLAELDAAYTTATTKADS
ncbi:hypothetical protein [Pseudomonas sp. PDM13]|uniref:hypothetical protein n=1 Tax=Pseudomonas sp. PDM13 TaxID=2769255 RepID=UPI0021DFD7DE|nr:hypothetical protein [Pseudomonas sp. PDM13]MCU9949849.1 hypothetical protein [Pseudomonas sp. PDM13]